jgi:hypothetical protein
MMAVVRRACAIQQTNTRRGSPNTAAAGCRFRALRTDRGSCAVADRRLGPWSMWRRRSRSCRDSLNSSRHDQTQLGTWSCGNNTIPFTRWHCNARTAAATPANPLRSLLPPQCQGVPLLPAAPHWPRFRRASSLPTMLCLRPPFNPQCGPRYLNLLARLVCPVSSGNRVHSTPKTLPSAMSNTSWLPRSILIQAP